MTNRDDGIAAYASRWTYAPGPRKTYLCPYCNEGAVLRDWGVVVDRFLNVCHEECLDRAMRMADCERAQAGATPSGTPAHDGESRSNRDTVVKSSEEAWGTDANGVVGEGWPVSAAARSRRQLRLMFWALIETLDTGGTNLLRGRR